MYQVSLRMGTNNVHIIFDKLLEGKDPSVNNEFAHIIEEHGIHKIMKIANDMEYDKKQEMLDYCARRSMEMMKSAAPPKLDFIIGCKDPSKKEEKYDGVFLAYKTKKSDSMRTVSYVNGIDWIGYPATIEEVVASYKKYLTQGWEVLENKDLAEIVDMTFDSNTITNYTML